MQKEKRSPNYGVSQRSALTRAVNLAKTTISSVPVNVASSRVLKTVTTFLTALGFAHARMDCTLDAVRDPGFLGGAGEAVVGGMVSVKKLNAKARRWPRRRGGTCRCRWEGEGLGAKVMSTGLDGERSSSVVPQTHGKTGMWRATVADPRRAHRSAKLSVVSLH